MFRWGILSCAKIAREKMLPAIARSQSGSAVAIAARDRDRAEAVAETWTIPHVMDSYEALLESELIDGVYIPVATSLHTEWALKAIAAGKHVLCEKPIGMNVADIDRLIAARDASGLTVSEAFMVNYHPQWAHVRDLLAAGAIGRLRHVEGVFTYRNTDPGSTRNQPEAGGGALPDIGVYPIVTTRIVTGREPVRVRGHVERDPAFGTDTYSNATVEFEDFTLSFYCSTQIALRQRMTFHGETGIIEVPAPFNAGDYGAAEVWLHDESHGAARMAAFRGVDQYALQAEAFARAVTGGETEGLLPLESSRANQSVIDAIYRAGESGGWDTVST